MKIKILDICWFAAISFSSIFSFKNANAQKDLKATVVERPSTNVTNSYYVSNKKPLQPWFL